jgi:hypothetical protein
MESLPNLKNIKQFLTKIDTLLERFEVNHIVCRSNEVDRKKWGIKEIDKFLNKGPSRKIQANSTIFLNSLESPELMDQASEDDDLEISVSNLIKVIDIEINKLCQDGENLYTLNTLIREAIIKLDNFILKLNYGSWLVDKNPNNNDNVIYLLVNKKRESFRKTQIDFETACKVFFDEHFAYRILLIKELKIALVDVYSKYLLLPFGVNPKIEYSCTQTDICELIYAISNAMDAIPEQQKLLAILMDIFNIQPAEFTNAKYEIRNRKKDKSSFVRKLADQIDNLPPSKIKSNK